METQERVGFVVALLFMFAVIFAIGVRMYQLEQAVKSFEDQIDSVRIGRSEMRDLWFSQLPDEADKLRLSLMLDYPCMKDAWGSIQNSYFGFAENKPAGYYVFHNDDAGKAVVIDRQGGVFCFDNRTIVSCENFCGDVNAEHSRD